jgi:hypothetical protein
VRNFGTPVLARLFLLLLSTKLKDFLAEQARAPASLSDKERKMPIAKSREWTEEEVQEAIATIKRERGLWEELEQVEKTTGDFGDTDLADRERGVLVRLHSDCELSEITQLYVAVRAHRRAELGLK